MQQWLRKRSPRGLRRPDRQAGAVLARPLLREQAITSSSPGSWRWPIGGCACDSARMRCGLWPSMRPWLWPLAAAVVQPCGFDGFRRGRQTHTRRQCGHRVYMAIASQPALPSGRLGWPARGSAGGGGGRGAEADARSTDTHVACFRRKPDDPARWDEQAFRPRTAIFWLLSGHHAAQRAAGRPRLPFWLLSRPASCSSHMACGCSVCLCEARSRRGADSRLAQRPPRFRTARPNSAGSPEKIQALPPAETGENLRPFSTRLLGQGSNYVPPYGQTTCSAKTAAGWPGHRPHVRVPSRPLIGQPPPAHHRSMLCLRRRLRHIAIVEIDLSAGQRLPTPRRAIAILAAAHGCQPCPPTASPSHLPSASLP